MAVVGFLVGCIIIAVSVLVIIKFVKASQAAKLKSSILNFKFLKFQTFSILLIHFIVPIYSSRTTGPIIRQEDSIIDLVLNKSMFEDQEKPEDYEKKETTENLPTPIPTTPPPPPTPPPKPATPSQYEKLIRQTKKQFETKKRKTFKEFSKIGKRTFSNLPVLSPVE